MDMRSPQRHLYSAFSTRTELRSSGAAIHGTAHADLNNLAQKAQDGELTEGVSPGGLRKECALVGDAACRLVGLRPDRFPD